ncbi:hypothetical protein D3C71_1908030 [compost metagenome]
MSTIEIAAPGTPAKRISAHATGNTSTLPITWISAYAVVSRNPFAVPVTRLVNAKPNWAKAKNTIIH